MTDHRRWGPQCPFIRKIPVGNVPLVGGLDLDASQAYQAYDTCGLYGIDIHPLSGAEATLLGDVSLEKLGVNKTQGPMFPQYASADERFKTFDGWPLSLKQRPDKLSEAGFYYTGKGDQTVCFHCGGGLKDWEDDDDPWMEHALWFSKCTYVLLVKGRQFVEQVCAKRDPLMSGEQVLELETPPHLPTSDTATILEGISTPSAPSLATSKEVNGSNFCKICFTEEMGVLFLPCGHIVACVKCAPSLTTCAVCRQPFTATVRAYLS
uniref:RING-type domain-containing protein n=1 Tax=Timema tahoe TaxID=61484 RepID=A0A7R9IU06_9NEOP|nr:unnamed protein product [Timema tahoe]